MPAHEHPDSVRDRNRSLFGGPFGAVYDFYIQRERLARVVGRIAWGSDVRPFYASMGGIGEVPAGGTIIDAPCGSGVALRALRRDQRVRYLGFDLSTRMLDRIRRRAAQRGLDQVTVAEADVQSLPVEDGSADLFLSYFGVHCLPDPDAALREAARCLAPGASLVGGSIVTGRRLLDRYRVRPGVGAFGQVGDASELRRGLVAAGLERVEVDRRGVFAYFSAVKPRSAGGE